MLATLQDLSPDDVHDVCVIGAGPAGISLALRLAGQGRRVLLLEGGEYGPDERTQDIYRGEVVGDPYFALHEARLRYLGGTSGHWAGMCRPLDAADFEPKPRFPLAHWPIRRADLDPYLADAMALVEIEEPFEDAPLGVDGVKALTFRFSPPTLFGFDYEDRLVDSDAITLALNANVFELEMGSDDRIAAAVVQGWGGERVRVRAGVFVLACGGIENSRLLLYNNARTNGRMVKNAAALGRYWMEHPHFTVGSVVLRDDAPAPRHVGLDDATRTRLGVLNCGLRLLPTDYKGTKGRVASVACIAPRLSEWAFAQAGYSLACDIRLRAAWEQEPRAENRVALSDDETDAFGVPRTVLHWRKSDQDLRTMRETALHVGRALAAADIGRLRLQSWVFGDADYPVDDELAGYHHMGGTRMADTPEEGVVDADLKVWGMDNLYVCGSSAFPSGGHANPTLTLVQLALRLGDHLARRA